ncbi:hypothetical protein OIV83_000660 [Microbotryomycetes sp. JL201]|nr:hypothetical protein OIV83_000660 [Microbotryomycetes sp. JL201]
MAHGRAHRARTLATAVLGAWMAASGAVAQSSNNIVGTRQVNISSDSTQMSYYSTWRSDEEDGFYTAYSNATDAIATFTFVGVAVDYIAVRKDDRGLCQLTLDGETSYTFYPYLATETWTETIPINATAYTATESVSQRPTGSAIPYSYDDSGSTNIAPIVGGVIGGVLAALLFAFLVFLWRRDRQMRDRNEGGAPLEKPKKADGRMAIEDEQPSTALAGNAASLAGHHAASSPPIAGVWAPPYGYAQPRTTYGAGSMPYMQHPAGYAPSPEMAYGQPQYNHVIVPTSGMTSTSLVYPASTASPYYGSTTAAGSSPPPPSHVGSHGYDPVSYRGVTPDQYPYVIQGVNDNDKRMYPVPEI